MMPASGAGAASPAEPQFHCQVDYERVLDCVHCGLCTGACPTYLELGTEADSPRGRIYLMRAVIDGRLPLGPDVTRHLDLCLDCRSCESACPSGVQYGRILEPFRVAMRERQPQGVGRDWFRRWILYGLFPYPRRMRWSLWPLRMLRGLGLDRLIERVGLPRLLPAKLREMYAMLPRWSWNERALPERLPPRGPRRATVALFRGCVADVFFRHVHWATARVLQENGCEVLVPRGQTCCGAIHYHSGAEGPAIERAVANAQAIDADTVDAVIVNVAGCGSMLKDYAHLPVPEPHRQRVRRFAGKVRDVSEYLVELGLVPPKGRLDLVGTYHDACHLCHAQQIRTPPRRVLQSIPGLELVPLAESEICCGAAGTYNLTEPEMAARLVDRKVRLIEETKAQTVFVANAGCALHIARRLRETASPVRIAHPVEALDWAYRGVQPSCS